MNSEKLDWRDALYLPIDRASWRDTCVAITADPDSFEDYDGSENPTKFTDIGFKYVILCDDIKSIILNLTEASETPSFTRAFEAFNFFLDEDAFINN